MYANESANTLTDVPSNSVSQCVGGTASNSEDTSPVGKAALRRARDAERKRRRRAEDPQLREREAAARRQRRAEDPQREAAAIRQRRAVDSQLREREAAARRKRRQENPGAEAACKRRRREADLDAARERERAAMAAWRAKQYATPNARFKRDFLDRSFGHSSKMLAELLGSGNDKVERPGPSSSENSSPVAATLDDLPDDYPQEVQGVSTSNPQTCDQCVQTDVKRTRNKSVRADVPPPTRYKGVQAGFQPTTCNKGVQTDVKKSRG
ncbi:uncharacterized protein LOC119160161 isoform X1 [Rhipicephalus microplus]|uniref:uncharacterized protein LOC119160161 isoform X1 n=1 Tax=Rhipicephalus microplus TaxID=6941 RepID=UPI003F6BA35C